MHIEHDMATADGLGAEHCWPECPRCGAVTDSTPIRFTFQGAAEFYCEGCERFFQDFDYGEAV